MGISVKGFVLSQPHLLFILFLAVFPFIVPYTAIANQILMFGLFAMGYNILLGNTGLLSFGHAALFGLGAYGAGMALVYLKTGLLTGILIGVGAASVGAAGIGYFCLKRRGIYFGMLTLAFAQLLYFLALYPFSINTRGEMTVCAISPCLRFHFLVFFPSPSMAPCVFTTSFLSSALFLFSP